MAADTISLTFDGYWIWRKLNAIPNEAGIYVVYDGAVVPWARGPQLQLKRILYIGEAERAQTRIIKHELWRKWQRSLSNNGDLYFSFAPAGPKDRKRAEAALIFEHRPPLNSFGLEFPFQDTTMIVDGRSELLKPALVLRGVRQPALVAAAS